MLKKPFVNALALLAIIMIALFAINQFSSTTEDDLAIGADYTIMHGFIESIDENSVLIDTGEDDSKQIKLNESTRFNIFKESESSFSQTSFDELDIGQNIEVGVLENGSAAYVTINIYEEKLFSVIKSFRDNILSLENDEQGVFTKTIASETQITVFNDDGVGVSGSTDDLVTGRLVMIDLETSGYLEITVYPADLFRVQD